MRSCKIFFLGCLALLCGMTAIAQTTMTDQQIIAFIQKEKAKNTPQVQILTQLMERGVTVDRVRKIRANYEKLQNKELQGAVSVGGVNSRLRTNNSQISDNNQNKSNANTNQNFKNLKKEKVDESELTEYQVTQLRKRQQRELGKELDFLLPDSLNYDEDWNWEAKPKKKVFGRDIFNNKDLTFEPEMNIATPADYRLGPGDAVYIDVWGASQKQYTATITPEGEVYIEDFGPIYVSGLSVAQANTKVRNQLGQRFGGSNIKLTVGQTKTITVNVMGEVNNPGTYTLSAFSTVFHALYMAGGTNDIGTMRAIKVYRNNREISTIDLYDYILNGNLRGNVRLASNDVITVGPYECLVNVTGKVKRPMFYEMKPTESVATLLKYAGGFTGDAYAENVSLIRKSGGSISVYTLNEFERGTFHLMDADSINVDSVLNRYKNMVELRGAVMRPGKYQMDGSISTIRQLIEAAGGVTEDAITTRGLVYRIKEDRSRFVERFNTSALLTHQEPDQALRNEDIIFIPSRKEANEELTLNIIGEVRYPGTYEFAANSKIEDLILQAGGLTDKASVAKVDVARRYRDRKALTSGEQVAEFFSFSIKNGYVIDASDDFTLQPFDEVFVRTSPGYIEQQHVRISGEVTFEGTYAITKKKYRLSDLVKAAGMTTEQAYLQGARLVREQTVNEQQRQAELLRVVSMNDSTDLRKINARDTKSVGINLDMAMANPGSDRWDIILRDGDHLFIPQLDNTISINGEVMYPNTVAYKPGASLSYYIDQCGGYGPRPKKSRIFAVHKNGTVSRVKSAKDIQPGSEIVVPAKPKRTGLNAAQWISLSATITTLAAVLVSAFRK